MPHAWPGEGHPGGCSENRFPAAWCSSRSRERRVQIANGQSALDFDLLPNFGDKNANQVLSSGKRIRGLFIRSNGQIINADVNGCLNIGRKELGDDWLKKLIETDEGCLMQPVTVHIGSD